MTMDPHMVQKLRHDFSVLINALASEQKFTEARACAAIAVQTGIWNNTDQRPAEYLPHLRALPVHDTRDFPFVSALEAAFPKIRAELDPFLEDRDAIFRQVSRIKYLQGKWLRVVLYEHGQWFAEGTRAFPETSAVIRPISEADCGGSTCLSWLEPATHLHPHCGKTNARLRLHMGLKVPSNTFLRVADQTLTWEEGKCFIFDDSFEHEVWNKSAETRVVLIMDIWHPDLTVAEKTTHLHKPLLSQEQMLLRRLRQTGLISVRRQSNGSLSLAPNRDFANELHHVLDQLGIHNASLGPQGALQVS